MLDISDKKLYNVIYDCSLMGKGCHIKIRKGGFVVANTIKITDDGLKKLQDELEFLKTEGRTDIAEKIRVARGYGDLSENSE